MRFNRSLRFRVALAFALFGAMLSLLLSAWLYLASHDAGIRLMDETLKAEMEDYLARRERNPLSLPPATVTVSGYVSPATQGAPPPPEALLQSRPGLSSLVWRGVPYRLLVQDVDPFRYYLLYNETHQAAREARFKWLLGIGVIMVTLLACGGGLWLAGRVISPVSALAARVKALEPEQEHSLLAADFPSDELGALARAFDHYLSRLRAFIERERAFTADVSHELRTPLSIIQGAAEMQAEDESLTRRQRQRALRVQRAAQDMGEIITALLVLAREQRIGTAAATPAEGVVRDAVEKHRYLLGGKTTKVSLEISADPRLAADRALTLIVVGNLVRNAFQHTDQGEVSIRLARDHLRIVDTGRGIAEQELERIFQRHYKGSESRGEGIGLSLTKRICDRYGWDIAVNSCSGCGTEVRLGFGRSVSPDT
jgi:signal transduction histidine kinase